MTTASACTGFSPSAISSPTPTPRSSTPGTPSPAASPGSTRSCAGRACSPAATASIRRRTSRPARRRRSTASCAAYPHLDRRRLRGREPRPVAAMTPRQGNAHLLEVVDAQKRGEPRGLYSVCSANPFVLEAAMLQARADGGSRLHRVHLEPGEPGRRLHGPDPCGLRRASCARSRATLDFPFERVLLGGDHLGPFPAPGAARGRGHGQGAGDGARTTCWRASRRSTSTRACAARDDPAGRPLAPTVDRAHRRPLRGGRGRAGRAARGQPAAPLRGRHRGAAPGGEQEAAPTTSRSRGSRTRERTLALTRAAFARARPRSGLGARGRASWSSPGWSSATRSSSTTTARAPRPCERFVEGARRHRVRGPLHRLPDRGALRALVEDHFAILKVGPALTFAFREAVFALAEIERGLAGPPQGRRRSRTCARVLEDGRCSRSPGHWQRYYHGDARRPAGRPLLQPERPHPLLLGPARGGRRALAACSPTCPSTRRAPRALVSQYLPDAVRGLRRERSAADPRCLIRVEDPGGHGAYARACDGAEERLAPVTRPAQVPRRAPSGC